MEYFIIITVLGSYTRLGGNFRPVMPLNGRQITEFKAFG